jgi:hypothetical protein
MLSASRGQSIPSLGASDQLCLSPRLGFLKEVPKVRSHRRLADVRAEGVQARGTPGTTVTFEGESHMANA